MKIAVGGIVHARSSIDPWLKHLAALDAGGHELIPVFVEDPGSEERRCLHNILSAFPAAIVETADGATADNAYRRRERNKTEAFQRLAFLRNQLAGLALKVGADALLSVDSDIMAPQDLLGALVAVGEPWVGALVRNTPQYLALGTAPSTETPDAYWNVLYMAPAGRGRPAYEHFKPIGSDGIGGIWPAGAMCFRPHDRQQERRLFVGAVALYGRQLLETVTWDDPGPTPEDPRSSRRDGEDVSFAYKALAAGYHAWYIPLICEHLMSDNLVEEHRSRCPICA